MRINRQAVKASSVRVAVLCTLLIALKPIAAVAETGGGVRYPINQPSQLLSDALRAIARQTNSSILFDPATVGSRVSQPVAGQWSSAEAITKLLEGTGLTSEVMRDGSIVVKPGPAPVVPVRGDLSSSFHESSTVATAAGRASAIELAQASVREQGALEAEGNRSAEGRKGEPSPQRIEVTGSRIKRVETDGALPVNVYTKADIEKSGQPTLSGFLNNLNEVSVVSAEGVFGGNEGKATVQLRGLPLGTTLVLLNGRRMQAGGATSANYFDLNLIPLAAVERVEVLPVGSSAVYGGDALAGVVNVILKKSIDGPALELRVGSAKGVSDGGFSLATGGVLDRGSFLLVGSLRKATPLTMAERDFFLDADYRRFGGPDARTTDCTPGTVSSDSGADLPGLSAPIAGIPRSTSGQPLSIAAFAATAGQPNLCNRIANGNGFALSQGNRSAAVHAAADYRLGQAWSIFGEVTYTDERVRTRERGLRLSNVVVPASNPYNPFGEAVRVTARLGTDNGTDGIARNTRASRVLLGLRGELAAQWEFEAAALSSMDHGHTQQLNATLDTAALAAALASSDPLTALNPFTTGPAASRSVLLGIWSDTPRTFKGKKDQLSAFARGPVLQLPAGAVDAIVGAEWARDAYDTATPEQFSFDTGRRSKAVFGELHVPLLSGGSEAGRRLSMAAVTLAGRRDDYSDFGAANTYQAGVEVRPHSSALLRASAATSFKPPTLVQMNVQELRFRTEDFGLTDPARGGELVVGDLVRGTNPGLRPEKGKAYSLGGVWEPVGAPGLRLGVSAWQVQIDRLISLPWAQDTINNEALFPGVVTRGPAVDGAPGPITQVLYTEVNFGRVEVAGIDFDAAHSWKTSAGRWHVAAGASRTNKYDVAIAPGAAPEERLGRRSFDFWAPKWKGRLSTSFDTGVWSLGVTGRYLGRYKDAGSSRRELGDTWIYDLSASVDLTQLASGIGAGAKSAVLSLGIVNAGNRRPEFVETSPFYDSTQADWRGRYASVRLAVGW